MIYGLIILVICLIGFLFYTIAPDLSFMESVGMFFMVCGIAGFIIWIISLSVFQINKNLDFQANLIARENIVYAIDHYEDINDDVNLNFTKYDLLKKAMDFNQELTVQQSRTKSIFYIWFCDPNYNSVEPIDYSPLVESR